MSEGRQAKDKKKYLEPTRLVEFDFMNRDVSVTESTLTMVGEGTAPVIRYMETQHSPLPQASDVAIPDLKMNAAVPKCTTDPSANDSDHVVAVQQSARVGQPKSAYCAASGPKKQPPERGFSGGAVIDVSPSGSWLAWFKGLSAPSPGSVGGHHRSAGTTTSHRTVQQDGLSEKKGQTLAQMDYSTPVERHVPSLSFKTQHSTVSSDHTNNGSFHEEGAWTSAGNNSAGNATQSTNGKKQPQYGPSLPTQDTLYSDTQLSSQVFTETDNSTISPSGASDRHPKKFFRSRGFLRRLRTLIIKHPCLTAVTIIVLCVSLAALLMLIFLWVIPHLIQSTLDASVLTLKEALLTDPQPSSFKLMATSYLNRPRGQRVTMKPFQARVFYVPSSQVLLGENDVSQQQRSLEASAATEPQHPLPLNMHQYVGASSSSAVAAATRLSSVMYPLPFSSESLLRHEKEQRRGLQATVSPDLGTERYALGYMELPETTSEGRTSVITYNTTFHIQNQSVFDFFLRELVTRGEAHWLIEGNPAVHILGLTYNNIVFSKMLQMLGPQLVHTEDTLESFMKAGAVGVDPLYVYRPSTLEDNQGDNDEETPAATSSKVTTFSDNNDLIRLTFFDITNASETGDGVSVQIGAEFMNTRGQAVVDPVGAVTLETSYLSEPILELHSVHPLRLLPGANPIQLYGTLPRLEDVSLGQREAITNLFEAVFRQTVALLEVRGIESSIPLYNAAVQALHLYTPLQLFKPPTKHSRRDGSPLIQSMNLIAMKLLPNPTDDTDVTLLGRAVIQIANPFGDHGQLEIPSVQLQGSLVFDRPTETDIYHVVEIATFTGDLKGVGKSRPIGVRDRLNIMIVSVHEMDVEFGLRLSLTDQGKDFVAFIRQLIQSPMVVLRLANTSATLTLDSPLGRIELNTIPLDQRLDMVGLQGLNAIRLVGINIGSIPLFTASSEKSGVDITVSVVVPSKAPINLYLGTLTIDLSYRREHLAFLTAHNCTLMPGDNPFNFTGTIRLLNIDVGHVLPLITTFLAGKPSIVEAEFVQSERLSNEPAVPSWIENALVGMRFSIPLQTPVSPSLAPTTLAAPRHTEEHNGLLGGGGGFVNSLLGGIQSIAKEAKAFAKEAFNQY